MKFTYKQRVKKHISLLKNNLCLGIDLHFKNLPPFLNKIKKEKGIFFAAEEYCKVLIDTASERLPAVKFQSAFFEALGYNGFKLLKDMIDYSKKKNLISILDAKRGDVSSTMEAYGFMAFELMQADALTISPYMGCDVIQPLLKWLKNGHGVYSIFLSSNPSGYLAQHACIADNNTLVADLFLSSIVKLLDKEDLKSSFGLVIGANYFKEPTQHLKKIATCFPLLIPGIGAQGETFSSSLHSIVHINSSHLLTISRELTGLGSVKLVSTLSTLRNMDEYATFLEERIICYVEKSKPTIID